MTIEFDTFFQRVKEQQSTQAGMTLDDLVAAEWNAPAMGSGLQARLFAEIFHVQIVHIHEDVHSSFLTELQATCV